MKSPFKFLDSFTKDDKDIFFGREKEIEELYSKIFESKILLVYGISGTGKTSLINCGLANKFQESDWLPVFVRRGRDITESLLHALEKHAITPFGKEEKKSLQKAILSLYLDHFKPIYFIFDQLEEVFIFGSREERTAFIKQVKEILQSDLQCRFIFVIREEYLANMTEFEEVIPYILSNRIRIEKMNRQQAAKAIEGPCKFADIQIEEAFPEKLLEKLNPKSTEIELTFLQIYLDKLYKRSDQKFTIKQIEDIGNVENILGDFLDEQIEQLQDPETGLKILKSFVSIKGTKRQITLEEAKVSLLTFGSDIEEKVLIDYIRQFVNLRILRDQDENGRYELVHDSIAQHIYDKITLIEREIFEVRQFIENAYNNFEKRGLLLTQEDLDYIGKFETALILPENQREFIVKSKEFFQKKNKTVRIITIISALFLILLFFFGVIFFNDFIKTSDSNRISALALTTVSSVEYNFMTAKDAYLKKQNKLSEIAVLVTFYRLLDVYRSDSTRTWYKYLKEIIPVFPKYNANIIEAKFSKDGKYIYGFLDDKSAKMWSLEGKQILAIDSFSSPIISIELSDNNNYLAIACKDSSAVIYNIKGVRLFDFKISYNSRNKKDIIRFTNDNRYCIALNPCFDAVIYDLTGHIKQKLNIHQKSVNSLALSPDNQFIATASSDHSLAVWYFNRVKSEYSLYKNFICHKDTVWSVQFSKNNRYVLTSSADSSAAIWNFNGIKIAEADDYIFNGRKYPVPGEEMILNKGNRYSLISYAEFSPNESVITLTRYNLPEPILLKMYQDDIRFKYYHTIVKDNTLAVKSAASSLWIDEIIDYLFYSTQIQNTFYDLKFSNDLKYSAIIINNKCITQLLFMDGNINILDFKGNHPLFSPDDQYLLIIDKNQIQLNLIDVSKIISFQNLK